MANQPFDTTIINPLERPKSSDINAAQSELRRNLLDYLYRAYATSNGAASLLTTVQTGFVGRSFAVEASTPTSMVVNIAPGMGFSTGAQDANVNGIVGLNDLSVYKPIYLSATKQVTVPTAPGAGFCRRDAIYVHVSRQLTDATLSDVYSVALGVFTPQTINKTMTFDLAGQTPQVIEAGSPVTWTSAIVYAKGAQTAYSTADSFLAAPITAAPAGQGWICIGVINVGPTYSTIIQANINDTRTILAPNGVHEIASSATLGGADFSTGAPPQLSNVKLRTPAGVRAAITKPSISQNKYTLTVVGLQTISDIDAIFTLTSPGAVSPYASFGRPVMAAIQAKNLNVTCDFATSLLLGSSDTIPALSVAPGQLIHTVDFTVGVVMPLSPGSFPVYVTDYSDFTSAAGATETVDTSILVKVTV